MQRRTGQHDRHIEGREKTQTSMAETTEGGFVVNYPYADQLIRMAELKMSLSQIANLCDTNIKTVQRWKDMGVVDRRKIQPLIEKVGEINLPAADLAEQIRRAYRQPCYVSHGKLKALAGKTYIGDTYYEELDDVLSAKGYYLIPYDMEDERGYFIVRLSHMRKLVRNSIDLEPKISLADFNRIRQEYDGEED